MTTHLGRDGRTGRRRAATLVLSAVVAAASAACATRAFDGDRPAVAPPLDGPTTVVAPLLDGTLLVPVTLDGAGPYYFALDTGATVVVVGRRVVDDAGLRTSARRGAFRTEVGTTEGTVEQADLRELRIGDARFLGVGALVRDLAPLVGATGVPLDGILGTPVLARHRWTIDLPRQQVTISASGGAPSGTGPGTPIEIEENLPFVGVTVAGTPRRAQLDTGQRLALALSEADVRELAPRLTPGGRTLSHVLDGSLVREVFRLEGDLVVGDCVVPRPQAFRASETRVGLGAFEGRTLVVDLPARRLEVR